MRRVFSSYGTGIGVALMLGGCATTPEAGILKSAYAGARGALEAGDYVGAVARYNSLLPHADDDRLGIAVRLELAHALLRAREPERALTVARELEALDPDPTTYANVKLVAAVAEHESAERAVARNSPYDEAQALARAALRSMDSISRDHPHYDPEGVLIPRIRKVRETLADLELRQVRADLQAGDTEAASERVSRLLREFANTNAAVHARTLIDQLSTNH